MKVLRIAGGPLPTNCYLLTDEGTGAAAVIDPGFTSERLDRAVRQAGPGNVRLILLTHGHFDHITGVGALKAMTGAQVCLPAEDLPFVEDSSLNLSTMGLPAVPPFSVDRALRDGDELPLGRLRIRVLHTPGHTAGSCCFLVGGALFSGDTLMEGSAGRTDFPTGDFRRLLRSLERLKNLEGDFRVYPGHGGETTLERERRLNPFMESGIDDTDR